MSGFSKARGRGGGRRGVGGAERPPICVRSEFQSLELYGFNLELKDVRS